MEHEKIIGYVGTLGISGIMVLLWGIIYKFWTAPSDRLKTLLVVCSGIVVGIFALLYDGLPFSFRLVSDYCIYGIQQGVTAIGLFKVGQAIGMYSYDQEGDEK